MQLNSVFKTVFIPGAILLLCAGCQPEEPVGSGSIQGSVLLEGQLDHSCVAVTAVKGDFVARTRTEFSGFYIITGLESGTYQISVAKDEWYISTSNAAMRSATLLNGDSILDINFEMSSYSIPPVVVN